MVGVRFYSFTRNQYPSAQHLCDIGFAARNIVQLFAVLSLQVEKELLSAGR